MREIEKCHLYGINFSFIGFIVCALSLTTAYLNREYTVFVVAESKQDRERERKRCEIEN
jgi:hypothetical protein